MQLGEWDVEMRKGSLCVVLGSVSWQVTPLLSLCSLLEAGGDFLPCWRAEGQRLQKVVASAYLKALVSITYKTTPTPGV